MHTCKKDLVLKCLIWLLEAGHLRWYIFNWCCTLVYCSQELKIAVVQLRAPIAKVGRCVCILLHSKGYSSVCTHPPPIPTGTCRASDSPLWPICCSGWGREGFLRRCCSPALMHTSGGTLRSLGEKRLHCMLIPYSWFITWEKNVANTYTISPIRCS